MAIFSCEYQGITKIKRTGFIVKGEKEAPLRRMAKKKSNEVFVGVIVTE